jgi:predicted RNA-binding Zn ribbon-like protein
MQAVLIGSHSALDFLNTLMTPDGVVVETLEDGRALLEWMVAAELIDEGTASKFLRRFGVKALDAAAQEARTVREWARSWLTRWREKPNADYTDEVATLNKLLGRETSRREVIVGEDGLALVETPHIASADALLGLVAVKIAELITAEQAALVRTCAGQKCSLWFLDRTKSHRRMFCSATACGNRAKVAAFRERQRK